MLRVGVIIFILIDRHRFWLTLAVFISKFLAIALLEGLSALALSTFSILSSC